jgi:chorismate dehydratase
MTDNKMIFQKDPYHVAMIPYINMAPYRQLGPPYRCRFISLVPRDSIEALQKGQVVAAAVPVGGLPALAKIVEPLGKFGIAAKKESMSVMFFSDRAFDIMDRTCTIHLTGDSATSVRLLYLLWVNILGNANLPRLAAQNASFNGELLIGDQALQRTVKINGWGRLDSDSVGLEKERLPVVTDLATVWHAIYKLPFVFARWVVRRDAPATVKRILLDWLETFRHKETNLVDACIEPTAQILKVDTWVAERYFKTIKRCLDDEHLLGQKRFLSEFQKVKRDPLFKMDLD